MYKTFLQIVNNVLIRLREPEVSSVDDNEYSKLLGVLVNDSRREIEDAHNWLSFNEAITVTTIPDVEEYTLTGAGDRFRVDQVLNETYKVSMHPVDSSWIIRQKALTTGTQKAAPCAYAFNGFHAIDRKVLVWPIPDNAYTLKFWLYLPPNDLVNNSDVCYVPAHIVEMLAHAKAVAERGEDGGQSFGELYQKYKLALSDAIAIEKTRLDSDTEWIPE